MYKNLFLALTLAFLGTLTGCQCAQQGNEGDAVEQAAPSESLEVNEEMGSEESMSDGGDSSEMSDEVTEEEPVEDNE